MDEAGAFDAFVAGVALAREAGVEAELLGQRPRLPPAGARRAPKASKLWRWVTVPLASTMALTEPRWSV